MGVADYDRLDGDGGAGRGGCVGGPLARHACLVHGNRVRLGVDIRRMASAADGEQAVAPQAVRVGSAAISGSAPRDADRPQVRVGDVAGHVPRGRGGLASWIVLWLGLIGTSLPVGGWAVWSHGWAGVWSVVGAVVICGVAGTGACLAVGLSNAAAQVWQRTLVAMAMRLSLPLAACVFAHFFSRPLASAGFIQYVLFFYLVVLAIETCQAFASLAPLRIAPRR